MTSRAFAGHFDDDGFRVQRTMNNGASIVYPFYFGKAEPEGDGPRISGAIRFAPESGPISVFIAFVIVTIAAAFPYHMLLENSDALRAIVPVVAMVLMAPAFIRFRRMSVEFQEQKIRLCLQKHLKASEEATPDGPPEVSNRVTL